VPSADAGVGFIDDCGANEIDGSGGTQFGQRLTCTYAGRNVLALQ